MKKNTHPKPEIIIPERCHGRKPVCCKDGISVGYECPACGLRSVRRNTEVAAAAAWNNKKKPGFSCWNCRNHFDCDVTLKLNEILNMPREPESIDTVLAKIAKRCREFDYFKAKGEKNEKF